MICRKLLPQVIGVTLVIVFLAGCGVPVATPASEAPAAKPTPVPPPTPTSVPPTPTSTPSPSPTPTAFRPSVEIVGEEEMVYDWTTDRCAEEDAPDLPVRAFRDAEGMVQINFSSPTNRRMIGEDLDSLQKDCGVILSSHEDGDPAQFNFREWLGSTYTLDGRTVYALIHNEYHGDDASRWYAKRDFGTSQGGNGWHYQSWSGSAYSDMWFDAQNDRWQGSQPLCQIGPRWAHPDRGCEPARTWVSPVADTVTVSGSAADFDPGGGDGVIVQILKGSDELWSATIENGDGEEYTFYLEVPVQEGDAIHFRVNSRGNTNNDTTYFNPEINVGPDPCLSGEREHCSMISLTYAESTDGGRTYTHPPAPNHLVANLPIRYEPDWGLIAIWQPSNIVRSPKDDYYYVLIQLDFRPASGPGGSQGICVMRTRTLNDPASWRAWDGEGFNMRFVNPYKEPDVDPDEHTCQILSPNEIGGGPYNLTYNSYFDKFLAVGHGTGLGPEGNVSGFSYALSDDLIHWTPMQLLMIADFSFTTDYQTPFLAYPSLLDPDDPSLNFEVTGQRPYLYFSRFQSRSLVDVDLLRVRVQFSK